jgi:hypothetical protein
VLHVSIWLSLGVIGLILVAAILGSLLATRGTRPEPGAA